MASNSPNERMRFLDEAMRLHDWKYHVEEAPEIENDQYDALEREFRALCDQYPELAAQFESHSKVVPIDIPADGPLEVIRFTEAMLSAKKIHTVEQLEKFMATFPEGTKFVYEVKLDGLSLKLLYSKGILSKMITRGSGMVGEDVTHAYPLFYQGVIPLEIRTDLDELELRGEAWIGIKDYLDYNASVSDDEKKKDPRNAVSGWVRTHVDRMDHKVLNTLQFSVYWSSETFGNDSYKEMKATLAGMGFDTPQEVTKDHIVMNLRSDLIPTDGIMVKVDDLKIQHEVGVTSRYPRWSVGYKFPPAEGTPIVEAVEWSTSGYGRVVPVVIYSPVKLGGVMCSRASLDNYGTFMELGLGVGDVISVTRNNDVIPRVNNIHEVGGGEPLEAPTECPSCSSLLEVRIGKTGSDLICNNAAGCPGQLVGRTVNMGDKFGFDIDGLGPAIVQDLVDRGYIKQPADVFTLKGAAVNLISDTLKGNIEAAKVQPLHRFIKALCLPDIGIVLATRIANAITDEQIEFTRPVRMAYRESNDAFKAAFENLLKDVKFLTSIYGISGGIAMSVVRSVESPMFEDNFSALVDVVVIDFTPLGEVGGFKVAMTGSFDQGKEALIGVFAKEGVELSNKLTMDCKYLIVGERPGKSKLLKATENGIPTLDVNEYPSVLDLINFIKEN